MYFSFAISIHITLILFSLLLQVIQVNLTNENLVLVEPKEKIEFTYSVNWYPTEVAFEDRFDNYLDDNFFEHQVRPLYSLW